MGSNNHAIHSPGKIAIGKMELNSLIDNLPIGIFRLACDLPGKILTVNPEFLAIFGYQENHDLDGMAFGDHFFSTTDWDDFLDQVIANHHIAGFEVQLKAKGGPHFWASINASLVEDPESGKEWIVGTVEDVDERKFEQLRSITHMEILRQASLSLTASLDLKDVLDTIAQCALDLVPGMRNCHIFLYQPGNGKRAGFWNRNMGRWQEKPTILGAPPKWIDNDSCAIWRANPGSRFSLRSNICEYP